MHEYGKTKYRLEDIWIWLKEASKGKHDVGIETCE